MPAVTIDSIVISRATALVAYVSREPGVSAAVVGSTRVAFPHPMQNVDCSGISLPQWRQNIRALTAPYQIDGPTILQAPRLLRGWSLCRKKPEKEKRDDKDKRREDGPARADLVFQRSRRVD